MSGAAQSAGAAGFDVPEVDAFTRPYWDAAAKGLLLLRHCAACDRAHHYPREFCPHCWSEDVRWRPASGRATLYTWSVVHRNDLPPFGEQVPYVAAVVDLAEGPRMMTEVVQYEEGALRIGMELQVAFRAGAPVFRPRPPLSSVPGPDPERRDGRGRSGTR
ncbi:MULTISPECIES: Zn-ribbon domain-containing OB-fold protein [Streptomyces]|uniref:Zn-ribbon domain-containing OB-fold protein n=1 Tax=Streptomyces TaxID=1883 RepID=UPI000C6369AF|nr:MULTISPECIES: OB-fold domain-containing protein [Streptomyces]PIB06216.1 nucleic acid-binding protein [Streptomyces sp. HG99]